MGLIEQNFDINFVKDIYNIISKIKEILPQFLNYFLNLQISKYEEELLNVINNFNQTISVRTNKFSKKEYLKMKQDNFEEDLKSKFKNYSENISKIYENDYIKRMKEYNEELEYLINNINSESELQNLNSFSSDNNISTNNGSDGDEEKRSSSRIIEGFKTFVEDNNKSLNNDDISEINFNCSVCSFENPKKATIFCDKCNQLFCKSCYDIIVKFDKNDNKCKHNIQNIAKMKEQNKIGKKLFLNSLKIFFKRIIIKSNYLLNNQIQKIKFIKSGDANSSKINFIKKKFFEYPIIKDINKINDSTEKKFLKSINNILVNNYEIKNEDINSYNISIIHEDLMSSLENIFMGEKNRINNSDFQIKELVKQQQDIDDDEDVEDDDITDEKNIIKKPKQKGFK
jgi:hypothetical protein